MVCTVIRGSLANCLVNYGEILFTDTPFGRTPPSKGQLILSLKPLFTLK